MTSKTMDDGEDEDERMMVTQMYLTAVRGVPICGAGEVVGECAVWGDANRTEGHYPIDETATSAHYHRDGRTKHDRP